MKPVCVHMEMHISSFRLSFFVFVFVLFCTSTSSCCLPVFEASFFLNHVFFFIFVLSSGAGIVCRSVWFYKGGKVSQLFTTFHTRCEKSCEFGIENFMKSRDFNPIHDFSQRPPDFYPAYRRV